MEYEHDLPDPEETESSSSSSSEESDKERKKEMKKWKRMEVVWGSVLKTMNEMQITMKETSSALTKRVEQLERACKSCSPLPTHSNAQQQERAASLPALLRTPQHSSAGTSSIHTTDQLLVLAPAVRQDARTPVNLLRPVEPIASSLLPASPVLHSASRLAPLPLSPIIQPISNTQPALLPSNPVVQSAQQPGAILVPQPVLQQPPVTQPILQPRVDTAFQPAEQSVPWPESQPAPQLRIPVAHPGIQPAPLSAPPPRMSHVIQPALQPVSQVAQSVQFGRLEPRQTEPLYSQRYQHPQPPGSSTQVLSAQSQYFSAVSAPQTYSQLYTAPPPGFASSYSAAYPPVSVYPSRPAAGTVLPVAEVTQPNLMEMILASSYGIPKPRLVTFKSGRESDFALLKKGLDSLLGPHAHLTEEYKYHILMDQLEHPCALQVARRYIHDRTPYTSAMRALEQRYGQPRQLVQSELSAILNCSPIKAGDPQAFEDFSLAVSSLVGLLSTMDNVAASELQCGSHVDRLLTKLPPSYRDSFIEYCITRGIIRTGSSCTYNMYDFSEWLERKSQVLQLSRQAIQPQPSDRPRPERGNPRASAGSRAQNKSTSIYYGSDPAQTQPKMDTKAHITNHSSSYKKKQFKPYCPYCEGTEHYLSGCVDFKKLDLKAVASWIKEKSKCWRCGRKHTPEQCTLKKMCSTCGEQHLLVLHDLAEAKRRDPNILTVSTNRVFLAPISHSGRVMLKVVPIQLHHQRKSLDTYALLDDGSEKTIILPAAVKSLGLMQEEETLSLRTIRQDVIHITGGYVSFQVSPKTKPKIRYNITRAFTAQQLSLAEQSCPVELLKEKYHHLQRVQLEGFNQIQPLVLIGSDNAHLITPIRSILRGSAQGPVAVCTKLGWAIQGPSCSMPTQQGEAHCLNISCLSPAIALQQDVQRLWQLDAPLHRPVKEVTRSKEDREAIARLEAKTIRVPVDGVERYATPLLRKKDFPQMHVSSEVVKGLLRSTERKLAKNPDLALTYNQEIKRLMDSGYVVKLTPEEIHSSAESWYVPHHIVHHNNKARVVFNCSFEFQGTVLNHYLLPGPPLGPTLLGVLLRFRQYPVAVSGDIKAMFHQVRLLPEDCPLLRFLWRNCETERPPDVYEWRVLPFGTTCSPCCATFALQSHVKEHRDTYKDIYDSVHTAFYVDNCLQSLFDPQEAKLLIDRMRELLIQGGFEIRQWASNIPEVVAHLPGTARSDSCERWLNLKGLDPQESTLGLSWHCTTDVLGYKHRPVTYTTVTLRNVYKVLASQYDPLGYICPYTTRAKLIVQALWNTERGWDEPIEGNLLQSWLEWEKELSYLQYITIPRCYAPPHNSNSATYEAHIFCDASEKAYGAVAYLRVIDQQAHTSTSFIMARSRVAPRKQVSIPRLELCAALTGAQLAKVLQTELSLTLHSVHLWTDSTTVLQWIQSSSCRYKVFVGTRICEIQELTSPEQWVYVNSDDNPADDITRGKLLSELTISSRWSQGPHFLTQTPDTWPKPPTEFPECGSEELRKTAFCGLTNVSPSLPDPAQYTSLDDLILATHQSLQGAATTSYTAFERLEVETQLLQSAQKDSFLEEVQALQTGNPVRPSSRLSALSPEYDSLSGLVRVGGRLRQATDVDPDSIHPVVLSPDHPLTQLIIKHYDAQLFHPGAERLYAELRRTYWILRGRQAIKKHQYRCVDCRRWRASPSTPKMADLPSSRLRLYKPPFWSTGVDCFGPYLIKIGRRREKRWGIIYKCLTTRCVHLDLIPSLDTDSFLMSLRRFIARRGKPYELWSDRGTNFRGGHKELQSTFESMAPKLQQQLAKQTINFHFNPPYSPHFGGTWEREIRSVKSALQGILKDQVVAEEVLLTALIEVEGLLNSKPLGYASADVADPDPITPNLLLMGRRDAALPQAVYGPHDALSNRRWKHSQVISDQFWKRFVQNYLPGFQLRHKWRKSIDNATVGQIVMIIDSNLPRGLWPVGTITKVFPGTDGVVRTAEVKVKDSIYIRPVTKLVKLPEMPEDLSGTSSY